VKSTKNQFQTITTQQFLKPTRPIQTKLKKKPISAHLKLQETLSRVTNTYTFTNKNKGKITPEKKMQELKPVVQLLQNRTSTFTKIKVFLEQAHLKIPLENLSKTQFNPSSHTESV